MRSTLKWCFSLILVISFGQFQGYAQDKFIPHTVSAGMDVIGLVRSIASSDENLGEIQLSTNVATHQVIFESGFANIRHSDPTYVYKTEGPFFRAGVDLTLNPKNPKGHKIFTGFRYAQSNYKNRLAYQSESDAFDDPLITASNSSLKGTWLEWTFGMKVNMLKHFSIGYTMRYKFSRTITGGESLASFDLPGYGKAEKDNNFGMTYYVFYRLQFRKPLWTPPTDS